METRKNNQSKTASCDLETSKHVPDLLWFFSFLFSGINKKCSLPLWEALVSSTWVDFSLLIVLIGLCCVRTKENK
jgi:hypothetical protein